MTPGKHGYWMTYNEMREEAVHQLRVAEDWKRAGITALISSFVLLVCSFILSEPWDLWAIIATIAISCPVAIISQNCEARALRNADHLTHMMKEM